MCDCADWNTLLLPAVLGLLVPLEARVRLVPFSSASEADPVRRGSFCWRGDGHRHSGLWPTPTVRCPVPQLKQLEVCGLLPDGFAVLCFMFFCSWDGDSAMAHHCWSRSRISSTVVGCTVSKNATPSLGRSFLRNGRAMATRHCSAVLQSSSN